MRDIERDGLETTLAARLETGAGLPGFGHPLYTDGDPRARVLLAAFALPPAYARAQAAIAALTGEEPNIDFALAALAARFGLPADAPFQIFAAARCSGWLAHALEQNETGRLIRPRARYVGPAPAATPGTM